MRQADIPMPRQASEFADPAQHIQRRRGLAPGRRKHHGRAARTMLAGKGLPVLVVIAVPVQRRRPAQMGIKDL